MTADTSLDATQARELVGGGALLVDVRSEGEWAEGHVDGARLLPWDAVAGRAATVLPEPTATIVLYCRSGARAQAAAATLRSLGYADVRSMKGGIADLERLGMPIRRGL